MTNKMYQLADEQKYIIEYCILTNKVVGYKTYKIVHISSVAL